MDFLFLELESHQQYLERHPFDLAWQNLASQRGEAKRAWPSVDDFKPPNYSPGDWGSSPYPPQLDDLIRLHYLVTSRRVTTILEFGVGFSTQIFDHALTHNKDAFGGHMAEHFRGSNLFECHTVDDDEVWLKRAQANFSTTQVHYKFSETYVSSFNGRICTLYRTLPNVSPDLIYLDGPDQYSPSGSIRGITTAHPDRMPMSADLLALEHFLLPGTLIVVDGRSANARFLRANFQRNWTYGYDPNFDQHFFELTEEPLGAFNRARIEFSLGPSFFKRAKSQ